MILSKVITTLTVSFINREFCIGIWQNDSVQFVYTNDGSVSLADTIHDALSSLSISMSEIDKIGFIVGPGSFTSIRMLICSILAIKLVYPDKIYTAMQTHNAIYGYGYDTSIPIVIKCGTKLFHVYYDNAWHLYTVEQVTELPKFISISDINIDNANIIYTNHQEMQHGIYNQIINTHHSNNIEAFYGFARI